MTLSFRVNYIVTELTYIFISEEEEAMENSTSKFVRFPLLVEDTDTTNYTACTIPWRFPSDDPSIPTPTELSWINLLFSGIPSYKYVLSFCVIGFGYAMTNIDSV
jgi:hypothetical protein